MVESSFILHQHTPALQSVDPRGLSVASILLCRSSIDHEPEMRISQASFDVCRSTGQPLGPAPVG
ncbi:Insecticidal toxin protein [Pseudomonas syringae pv. maculicola]|nr:Insecticidal toxin protein [Pseudomonas syringae pv. maculicola str. M6]KPX74705.1 Insecticidal toxin protein [Pseudomonas syringae pv. maculicola]